jgi:hypothetical protein
MDFDRALNWLHGYLFGAICLGCGIAFASHGLTSWEMPPQSP